MRKGVIKPGMDTIAAANYLGISPYLMRQYDKRQLLKPRYRIGRNRRYFKEDLDEFAAKLTDGKTNQSQKA